MGHQYAGANSFPSDYTIPDDGDTFEVVSVNVAFEALGDRTKWLKTRTGVYYLADYKYISGSGGLTPTFAINGSTTYDTLILSSNVPTVSNDIVEVGLSTSLSATNAGGSNCLMSMRLRSVQNGGLETDIPGAEVRTGVPDGGGGPFIFPASMGALLEIGAPGTLDIYWYAKALTGQAGDAFSANGRLYAFLKIWRPQ